MDPSETIIVGVITGIITSFVLFTFNKLIKNSLIPWYRSVIYKGMNVSGQWFSYSLFSQKVVLEIEQNCEVIKGKATYVLESDDSETDTIRTFDVKGEIRNKFIIMNLYHTDNRKLGVVTYLFEAVGDGSIMEGVSSAYELNRSKIGSMNFKFYRNEENAKLSREKVLTTMKNKKVSPDWGKMVAMHFVLPKNVEDEVNKINENSD